MLKVEMSKITLKWTTVFHFDIFKIKFILEIAENTIYWDTLCSLVIYILNILYVVSRLRLSQLDVILLYIISQNIQKMVSQISCFLHDKMCSWFLMMVSLALLKLHCVSKITSSHLCLQSIPHLDMKHYISPALPAIAYCMPQIASAGYRMAALCYHAPLGPFSFSASHSMYGEFILRWVFVSAPNI